MKNIWNWTYISYDIQYSTFFLNFPRMWHSLLIPSKQNASKRPFPSIFRTCAYSVNWEKISYTRWIKKKLRCLVGGRMNSMWSMIIWLLTYTINSISDTDNWAYFSIMSETPLTLCHKNFDHLYPSIYTLPDRCSLVTKSCIKQCTG